MDRFREGLYVYTRLKMIITFCLGVSSGFPLTLILSTLFFWLAEVGIDRTTIGLLSSATLPYVLKPLWAPILNGVKLPVLYKIFGRRTSWMIVIAIGLVAAIVTIANIDPRENMALFASATIFIGFMGASQDIVIDAYRLEILEDDEVPAGAVMIQFGGRAGYVFSGVGALVLAEYFGWSMAYMVTASLVLFGLGAMFFYGEPKEPKTELMRDEEKNINQWAAGKGYVKGLRKDLVTGIYLNVIMPFKEFSMRSGWVWILLFLVFLKVGDALAGVMTTPLIVELGFSKIESAYANKTIGLVAILGGTFLGGVLLSMVGMYRGLMISALLMMVTNLNFILLHHGGHDVYMLGYVIGFENLATGIGAGVVVAYMSGLCNIGYTATQYALLTSLVSLTRGTLGVSSGALVDSLGWDQFFILTTVIAVPALFILVMLKKSGGISEGIRDHSH
jgi:PAT family beta-lactamase induction signal transducer AmpG